MNKITIVIFIFLLWHCKPANRKELLPSPIFIYDSIGVMKIENNSTDSSDYTIYTIRKSDSIYYDSLLIKITHKYYDLHHYLKYGDDKDSIYLKHQSCLNSIDYFNNEWLNNEEKLDLFWQPTNCWQCGGFYDTTQIFLIRPVKNTDSVIFRQAHRWYHQTQ